MEILTSQGLLISPNTALPVTAHTTQYEETNPFEDTSSCPSLTSPANSEHSLSSTGSIPTLHLQSNDRRKLDPKWNKPTNKSTLPLNLISATNQQKVAQNLPIKQQLPLKLATRLSSSGSGTSSPVGLGSSLPGQIQGPQQVLPLKLSQMDERVKRGSSSGGYQRLGSGSFSPPEAVSLHTFSINNIINVTRI